MKIKEARFAGSSTQVSGRPRPRLPEFAFIGRSNVGKSSLINMLCGKKNLAMTSSTPGKTRLVNHFLINGEWYLVDLPGYGYAKMSLHDRDALQSVIRDYLLHSGEMMLVFVLIDSRHPMQTVDRDFLTEIGQRGIPFSIIFTKGDKMGPTVLQDKIEAYKQQLLEDWETLPPVFASSAVTGLGREEILLYIDQVLKEAN